MDFTFIFIAFRLQLIVCLYPIEGPVSTSSQKQRVTSIIDFVCSGLNSDLLMKILVFGKTIKNFRFTVFFLFCWYWIIIPFHTLISIIPFFHYNYCILPLFRIVIKMEYFEIIGPLLLFYYFLTPELIKIPHKNISPGILHKTIVWRHFGRNMLMLAILFDDYSMVRLIFNIEA